MEPTPYAEKVLPDILHCFDRLSSPDRQRSSFNPLTATRTFRICMTDISEIVVLPVLVNELRRLASGVAIETEHISAGSRMRLESGDVDLAVGYMPDLEAGFYQQSLFRQGFVCLGAKNHPRIRERLTRQAFCREGHIVVTTSGTGHSIVDRQLDKRGIERHVVLRVPSFLAVGRLVADTELLATVPRRLGEALMRQEQLNLFTPPMPLPAYAVKLHWHARFHADEGNIWLRKCIAQVMSA
jgi:DNA-binding transcriptional LysR family regulator